ncbi:MAG: undecaprenyl-diphosphate phosphatase [Candidatus Gallimonas sp.]
MEIWQAIVLGTVQGLTEFLPVSSSGHLVLLQQIMNADFGGNELFFDVMLHFGTLIAVFFVFWRDVLDLFKKPFKTLLYLIVATIPAGLVGLFLNDYIEEKFYGGAYLAIGFALTALILLLCEFVAKRRKNPGLPLCWRTTVPMGLMQAIAVIPGISRSGSTIAAGVFAGADTKNVAKFSFLMSIPVILGSVVVSLKDVAGETSALSTMGATGVIAVLLGVLFAALAGLFAIKLMLKVIGKANYKWFSLYLVALSFTCFALNVCGIL